MFQSTCFNLCGILILLMLYCHCSLLQKKILQTKINIFKLKKKATFFFPMNRKIFNTDTYKLTFEHSNNSDCNYSLCQRLWLNSKKRGIFSTTHCIQAKNSSSNLSFKC